MCKSFQTQKSTSHNQVIPDKTDVNPKINGETENYALDAFGNPIGMME